MTVALKDIAALLSAVAWPIVAIVAGAILLKKTKLLWFLDEIYKGYSDKVAKAKSIKLPWITIDIPDKVFNDLVVENKRVSVEGLESPLTGNINPNDLIKKYDTGTLFENIREYPSFNHNAVPLVQRRREGWYSARLFLEFADDVPNIRNSPHRAQFRADQIAAVHYLLHESFPTRVISTTNKENGFEAWLSLTDEFTVIALVEHKDRKTRIALSRYLTLPRPT
jgi:hypothetical protein